WVGMDVAIVAWSTVLQQQVPEQELGGRLSSLNSLGEQIAIPVGYLLVAVTSAYWGGSGRILLVCSAVILVAGGVANACVRDVYRIRRV
nr:MFS transporter [Streptomyces sp. SID7803]